MNLKKSLLPVFVSAIIITLFFYKQGIGLNLFLFELLYIAWLIGNRQLNLKSRLHIICFLGFIITGVATVIVYSAYAYWVHFITLFLFAGTLNYTEVKSLTTVLAISSFAFLRTQTIFINKILNSKSKNKTIGGMVNKTRVIIIPLLIIAIFVTIYSLSSPAINKLTAKTGLFIQKGLTSIFGGVNFSLVFTFLISLLLSTFLIIRTLKKQWIEKEYSAKEYLTRTRINQSRNFKITALKNEYKSGIFLFVILNLIILVVNITDIHSIWFNFEWDGETLKQFVHEGTYLLILSILISIALVLYFFRGNLNFYKNNTLLKLLSYIWLIQNGVLLISVAIRNYRYIEIFALAYKRIGVILFLLMTLYGLYSVFIKIKHKKSTFYLFKTNTLAIYIVLVISSLINWDVTIAKYNFANAQKSYLDIGYMYELSDKALPYLETSTEAFKEIEIFQNETFHKAAYPNKFSNYSEDIKFRKQQFKKKWERKNFLSWNLTEYLAYRTLFKD